MITRRTALTTALCAPALLLSRNAPAESIEITVLGHAPDFAGTLKGFAPGDMNYKHDQYHPFYQILFGTYGKCSCGDGDCRVTEWRETRLGSPKGYDIVVNRKWWPLPIAVWMPPDPHMIPKVLLNERAHVCAYYDPPTIACALINVTGA